MPHVGQKLLFGAYCRLHLRLQCGHFIGVLASLILQLPTKAGNLTIPSQGVRDIGLCQRQARGRQEDQFAASSGSA
jgi:hypothetical protein